MSARFICLMTSKGGAGKSSLCCQISTELHRLGYKVRGIDYDSSQRSFGSFIENNSEMFVDDDPDFVVLDTQGAHTQQNIDLINTMKAKEGLILVPYKSTEDQVRICLEFLDRLERLDALTRAIAVTAQATRKTDAEVKHYKKIIGKKIAVAKTVLVTRKAYSGKPNAAVRNEISQLLNEIIL